MEKNHSYYFLVCIIFLGFVTRVPITSISPLLDLIKGEYGVSNSTAGVLTTIPLAVFAACSPLVPVLARRIRRGTTVLLGAAILSCGILVRAYCGLFGLFAGTVLIALGVVIENVMVPAIIKWKFPEKSAFVTGIHISSMTLMIAVALGVGSRLAERIGWSHTTAVWVVLGLAAVFVVFPAVRTLNHTEHEPEHKHNAERTKTEPVSASIMKEPMAWWITAFFGVQSFLFFSTLAWLPTILMSRGMPSADVGNYAFVYTICSLPTNFSIALIAGRLREQKLLALSLGCVYFAGFMIFLIAAARAAMLFSVILMGLSAGGFFSLVFSCRVLRCRNKSEVERLVGMSESIGYILAAIGPTLLGAIADFTGGWQVSIAIMTGGVLMLTLAGWKSGRNRQVFTKQ